MPNDIQKSDTPRVDAFTTALYHESCADAAIGAAPGIFGREKSPEECYGLAVDLAKELERELAQAIVQRDEARELADEQAMGVLSSSCGVAKKGGWRENHYYHDDEPYLIYAAARGLIERDAERVTRYRVTDAGRAVRGGDEGPCA